MNQEVQQQINETLEKVFADDSVFVQALVHKISQHVYRELQQTIASAGELDLYNYQSIEQQCTAHAAREIADRISWITQ